MKEGKGMMGYFFDLWMAKDCHESYLLDAMRRLAEMRDLPGAA